jgi:hypothetical protein
VCAQLVDDVSGEWWLAVETTEDRAWCSVCGVRALRNGRRRVVARDRSLADRPVVLMWAKAHPARPRAGVPSNSRADLRALERIDGGATVD